MSGSTGSVTTIEYKPGLTKDFPVMLSRIAPKDLDCGHKELRHDDNGLSHVKASLMDPLTVPFIEGELCLGRWQQIVFVEFDTKSRSKDLILQIMGE